MDFTSLLTTVVTGALGGNAAGAALKDKSLGTVGNSLAGVLGGGIATQLLPLLSGGSVDVSSLVGAVLGSSAVGNVAGSGIGGAIAMYAIAYIKQLLNKQTTPTA